MQILRKGFTVILLVFFATVVLAAPKAELWQRWLQHNPQSQQTIDHSTWDRFLDSYLVQSTDGINRLNYGEVTEADRKTLDNYVATLEETTVSELNRQVQRAFWINLYNALTVKVVLEHYPVASIRDIDISPGLFADGPWKKKLLQIEGEGLSLDDIEHRILRPIWKDPRIHYGVNCAAIGCPNLQSQAFTAQNTDALLDKGAREYVNHPRGVHITDNDLVVSSIYHWFKEDFGGDDRGVIAHLKRYAEESLRAKLDRFDRIADHRYDWSLNDVER